MDWAPRTTVPRGRLRLALGAAVVVTALAMGTAGASTTTAVPATAPTLRGANPDTRPRSLTPGFLLDRGRYTTIEAPQGREGTIPFDINNRGQIVGRYETGSSQQAFLRDKTGRFTTLRIPGAKSAWAVGINDRGQIVGVYATDLATGTTRGFLLDNGRYTTFAAPGLLVTFPYGINNRGQIAGFTLTGYEEPFQGARGFLLARGARGPFTPVDFPGAPRTVVGGLNDRGQLVGAYENPNATPAPSQTARRRWAACPDHQRPNDRATHRRCRRQDGPGRSPATRATCGSAAFRRPPSATARRSVPLQPHAAHGPLGGVAAIPSLPWSPPRAPGQARACLSNPDRSEPVAAANTQENRPHA
jgi:hypothetical protein